MTLHLFGRGAPLAAALLVAGCDGRDIVRSVGPAPAAPDAGAPVEPPVDASAPEPPPPEGPAPGIADPDDVGDPALTDMLARGVLQMLEAECGACHAGGNAEGGFGDVLDIPALITRGAIVPGASADSPLLQRIVDGTMRPDGRGPTTGEAALLGAFIDELGRELPSGCDALPFVSDDAVYATLLADLKSQPAEDRPFSRYLGLSYASNAGLCGPALEQQRHAAFKAINSVSRESALSVPVAVDEAHLLYRIDIRRYDWDRSIDLEDDGTADFADGWLAILDAVGPYAVELTGPEADEAKREAGTLVPLLPVNAFVHAVSQGDLYSALIGARQNVYDSEIDLGIDTIAQMDDGIARRAGFTTYRGSNEEYFLTRFEQDGSPGRYYWSLDSQRTGGGASIFNGTLDLSSTGGQYIFQLPNGLQAYSVANSSGQRLAQIPLACVDTCDRPETLIAAACHACHSAGLVPVRDMVRDYVERFVGEFDVDTFEAVQQIYPTRAELEALMAADSETHQAAVAQAGVPRGEPDPISRVFFQFERQPLGLEATAAELGVTSAELRESLPRQLPFLGALGAAGGHIERTALTSSFFDALCTLHSSSRNHPTACP